MNPSNVGIGFFQLDASRPATGDYSVPASFLDTVPKTSQNTEKTSEGFHWWPALQQSFNFLLIEHGFRIATDPFLRYLLWHKPFWHDWAASDQHFYFNQWGDGDDFLVNYIGHPMEGGVTGYIEIVNDPKGRSLTFGRSRAYWMSRLRAMAFAAVYSANFEAGPILSEAAIGSEGGYFYKPGCDPFLTCQHPGKKPITNNTGWVDFTVTPLVGMGWIVLEDAIETELVDRWAKDDDRLRWKILRASLSPTHVMANFVEGQDALVPIQDGWARWRIAFQLASGRACTEDNAGRSPALGNRRPLRVSKFTGEYRNVRELPCRELRARRELRLSHHETPMGRFRRELFSRLRQLRGKRNYG